MSRSPQVIRSRLIFDFFARRQPHDYGPHPSQCADLYVPAGDSAVPAPVMVTIHGGSWQAGYGKIVMRGLLGDLVRRGWAVWNIEYRRIGAGGGWPATFDDVALAIDHLAELEDPRLDLDRLGILGHSAGGHLALWAAGRPDLAPGAPGALDGAPRVCPRWVVSQAGVADLAGAFRGRNGGSVRALMGGSPEQLPERYAAGDPIRLLPLQMPTLLVHGVRDETVSVERSRSYARAAALAGGEVELVEIDGRAGRHRAHIDPTSRAWAAVTRWLPHARA
jgi:acetyl esterase/lipase